MKDVQVGDVLQILEGETIPADCILLRTKQACRGMCFVQTTELDGEANLKPVIANRYIEYHFKDIFIDKTISLSGAF